MSGDAVAIEGVGWKSPHIRYLMSVQGWFDPMSLSERIGVNLWWRRQPEGLTRS